LRPAFFLAASFFFSSSKGSSRAISTAYGDAGFGFRRKPLPRSDRGQSIGS
jgi:hypothetical protein